MSGGGPVPGAAGTGARPGGRAARPLPPMAGEAPASGSSSGWEHRAVGVQGPRERGQQGQEDQERGHHPIPGAFALIRGQDTHWDRRRAAMESFTTLYATQGLIASGKAPGKGPGSCRRGGDGRGLGRGEPGTAPRRRRGRSATTSVRATSGRCAAPRNVTGFPAPARAGRRLQNLEIPL